MNVAGAQGTPFQITELVEQEKGMVTRAAEVPVVGCSLLIAMGRANAAVHVENDLRRRVPVMNLVDPHPVHVGQGFNVRVGGQKLCLKTSHLAGGSGLSFDGLAADDPPHDRVEAEPVGIVHVVVPAKASENGLAELPDKTVAAVLPATGVRECIPGNLGQSDRIIQFPIRQQPGVGRDLGTVELQLQPTVKTEPQNPRFPFHPSGEPYQQPHIRL